jgi:cytochrome c551/c552
VSDLQVVPGANPVSEEDRQIEGYHKALHSLFKGADDIIVAQAVASFMGCTMAHSEKWRNVIPGFVQQTIEYANLAMAAHKMAEQVEQPDLNNTGESDGCKEGS